MIDFQRKQHDEKKIVRAWIITNITFVRNAISHKCTFNRLSRKCMMFMEWQMDKTNTTKSMHVNVVGMMMIKTIIRRCKVQDTGRQSINSIDRRT